MLEYADFDVPGGTLTVVTDSAAPGDRGLRAYGAVIAATYRGLDDAIERIEGCAAPVRAPLDPVAAAIGRYCDGELTALDEISVRQRGGPYQCEVWLHMRMIRPGTVDSYGELAPGIAGTPGSSGTPSWALLRTENSAPEYCVSPCALPNWPSASFTVCAPSPKLAVKVSVAGSPVAPVPGRVTEPLAAVKAPRAPQGAGGRPPERAAARLASWQAGAWLRRAPRSPSASRRPAAA